MKVVFAVPAYWPSVIGVSLYCQDLAEGLVRRGHEVTVYTGWQPGLAEVEEKNGVTIKRFGRRYITNSFYLVPGMARTIVNDGADIVHAHHYGYYEATAGLLASRKLDAPLVFGPYYHPPVYGLKKRLLQKVYHWRYGRPLLTESSAVLPHTEMERRLLIAIGGNENSMKVLPNTVNAKVFRPCAKKRKIVLFASSLITEKGAGVAMDIAERITRERPDVYFIFKGKPFDGRIIEKIESLAENENIEFIYEDISTKELARLYSKASVVILPSKYEAFSKVLAEAQACGTPVVATRVGGIPEVVKDGNTGFLVNYGAWNEMEEKVMELIDNPRLANKMGMRGRKHVERNFSIEIVVNKLEKIYRELV